MNKGIYKTKMNGLVKIVTFTTVLFVALIVISLALVFGKGLPSFGKVGIVFLILFIIGVPFYFFTQRIIEIQIVENKGLILKKLFNNFSIPFTEIKSVKKVIHTSVPMTYGSKGVFGFIGTTMDNYSANVSDTSNMFAIETVEQKFLLSCENSNELVKLLKAETNKQKI